MVPGPPEIKVYSWYKGSWGSCDVDCLGDLLVESGYEKRIVACKQDILKDGEIQETSTVPDSVCIIAGKTELFFSPNIITKLFLRSAKAR